MNGRVLGSVAPGFMALRVGRTRAGLVLFIASGIGILFLKMPAEAGEFAEALADPKAKTYRLEQNPDWQIRKRPKTDIITVRCGSLSLEMTKKQAKEFSREILESLDI